MNAEPSLLGPRSDADRFGCPRLQQPLVWSGTEARTKDADWWLSDQLITAPYFLATKLEAFRGRGSGDYRTSRDLEDIVTVVDDRAELLDEIALSESELPAFLRAEFRMLLSSRDFLDAVLGFLLPDARSQQRIHIILERIQRIPMRTG